MDHVAGCKPDAGEEVAALRARVAALERMLAERERMEARLWLLSSLVQQTSDGLAVVNLGGTVIFANEAFARMHGYAPESLIGKHLSVFHTAEQMASVEAANRTLREWGRFDGEIWHARQDGTVFPAMMRNTLLRDASGKIVGMIGTMQDITVVKEAEKALRDSEERFRIVTESSLLGVYVYQGGRLVYVNPAFAGVFGYEPDEIVGMADPLSLVHPADRAFAAERIRRRLDGEEQVTRYRFRGLRKDGTEVWCEVFGRFLDYNGRPSIMGVLADITAQMEAEARQERLLQAIEHSSDGIGIWDEQWRLLYANAAMSRILGSASMSDTPGGVWKALADGHEAAVPDRIAESLRREGRWSGRLSAKRPGGECMPVAMTCSSFVTATGDPMIVGSIRDVSTEERYLAQIRRLTADAEARFEAEKAEIARELHDELGQLLTVLNLDLAWVGRRIGQADASIRDRMAQMRDITNEVTERVRHLSKSLHPPVLEHEGLAATIQWQAAEFERRTGVPCGVTIKPPDPHVAERLAVTVYRIVQEALTNVARHAHATRCEVSLVLHRGVLEVAVRDNGVGAAPARLAESDSLGITAMRERAVAAGGTLRVESRPGGGVCVLARFPSRRPHKPRGS